MLGSVIIGLACATTASARSKIQLAIIVLTCGRAGLNIKLLSVQD